MPAPTSRAPVLAAALLAMTLAPPLAATLLLAPSASRAQDRAEPGKAEQSKDDTRPAPTPAPTGTAKFETVTVNDQPTPPVELRASLQDGKPVCSPATLTVPADGAIDLRVRNDAGEELTLASSELFAHGRQIRFDGQIAHAMSEIAYTIKPNADGRVVVRTPKPGRYDFTCATTGTQGTPFKGTVEAAAR